MEERGKTTDLVMDALIVLALVAALAEDAAGAAGAAWPLRRDLGFLCAIVDIAFTVEFALRLASAAATGRVWDYLGAGLGWADFLTSIPLFVLVSGPFSFGALEGGRGAAEARALVAVSALGPLRALRALRLLRFVRLLPRIKGYDSVATARHVTRAASLGMIAVVAAFVFLETLAGLGFFPGAAEPRAMCFASLSATLTALAVAVAAIFPYGKYFARGVAAPTLAAIRWASGGDSRVRSAAPLGRDDEEPFVLAGILDARALSEASGPVAGPASPAEIEGLLARASSLAAAGSASRG